MKHKIIVGQVNDVYVISDDGAVSRTLGLNPPTPWHLIADTQANIGARVAQMENLLDRVLLLDRAPQKGRFTLGPFAGTPNGGGETDSTGPALPFGAAPEGVSQREHDKGMALLQGGTGNGNGNGHANGSSDKRYFQGKGKKGGKLKLDDLGMKNQQLWRLKAAGIKTVKQLGGKTEDQLLALDGVGPAIVKAAQKGLKKHGLRLTSAV